MNFLVICLLVISVQSMDWIDKPRGNAITLLQKQEAFISTETRTIKYRFDLNPMRFTLSQINSRMGEIRAYCEEKKTRNCKRVIKRLESLYQILEIKLTALYGLNMDPIRNFTEIFHSDEDIHMVTAICILDIHTLDNLILAIQDTLESGDSYSFFNVISESKFETDLIAAYRDLKSEHTLPGLNCNETFDYKIHKENILKSIEIKAEIKNSVLLLNVKVPIVEKRKYTIYKIISTPIHVKQKSMIYLTEQKYILKTCNDSFYHVSNENIEDSKILSNKALIIT